MSDGRFYVKSTDGVRIAWRQDGAADGPALLLCSMGTAALSVWDSVVPALADQWRVLRYDRRGDGDSEVGPPESHTLATYAQDALRVLDAAGCRAVRVCGMAFGARIATRIALDAPERVCALMLFDATAGPPASEALRRAGSAEAAALRAAAGLPNSPVEARWFHRRDPAGAGLSGRALTGHPPWTPGLERIRAPALVACGDHDPNLAGSKRMATEMPNARFQLMPMTGHASLLDRPDLVLALMQDFLDRP